MTPRTHVTHTGFVHAEGRALVDGEGRPLLMRGVGLGGWLLPEGYMWRFPREAPQSPREIEAFVVGLVGAEAAAAFWRGYRQRFIAEADVERIAREGFDHVRLPMNARLLLDEAGDLRAEGLEPIDRLIEWCRRYRLWVILDLHGAPGGQTGTNIDDSPRGLPDLFMVGGTYRERTLSLWTRLAERYRDETVVAGYDLLNEPLPHEYGDRYASDLVRLYRDLTAAIRDVDPSHLLIYEGTRWSTDWSIFREVWDGNSMLQFHKYWSAPDRPSIAAFIERGEALSLPIYMGEGGENDCAWLQTAFGLYEDLGISWNFWPWKKLATWNSPASVVLPDGWEAVVTHAAGRGPKPSTAEALRIFDDLLVNIRLDACEARPEVVQALFHRVPTTLAAEAFGFRGEGTSYRTAQAHPLGWFRSDERVTMRSRHGSDADEVFGPSDAAAVGGGSFDVVIGEGDWIEYSLETTGSADLEVTVDLCGDPRPGTRLAAVEIDGVGLVPCEDGEPDCWETAATVLPGRHGLRVVGGAPDTGIRALHVKSREVRTTMRMAGEEGSEPSIP